MGTSLEYLVLGRLEVRRDGVTVPIGAPKQRALLALLLLNANENVSRERLIEELWGAQPPATVSTALRVRVAELRRLLEPERAAGTASDVIVSSDGRLCMNVEIEALDMLRFEALVGEAEEAAATRDHESAAELLRTALALWRGPALEDFSYEPFAQPAIARLEELRATALERRIDAELELGRHERLVPELDELITREPHREHLRGQLMLALYRSARQSDALDAYQDARRQLADVLGIEPSQELKELEQAILRQDPELAQGRGDLTAPQERTKLRNPYKGLRPFDSADADDFFGRDTVVAE
ncbi:MAG: AfsR/SARP family transcriptional regulator, partial [Gaiellaceae bacterium]